MKTKFSKKRRILMLKRFLLFAIIVITLYSISVVQKRDKYKSIKKHLRITHPFNFSFIADGRSGGHLVKFSFYNNSSSYNSSENVNSYSFKIIENNFNDSMIVVFDSTNPKTNLLLYKSEDFDSFGIEPNNYYKSLFYKKE